MTDTDLTLFAQWSMTYNLSCCLTKRKKKNSKLSRSICNQDGSERSYLKMFITL